MNESRPTASTPHWSLRLFALLLLAGGVAAAVMLRRHHIEWSTEAIRDFIQQQPLAPLVFVVVLMLRPFLVMPSSLLMAAGGALFGVVGGTLLGTIGGALSGLLMFAIARALGRAPVERRFGGRLRRADAYVGDRGARMVALYTAFPATPLAIAQIACGLSAIRVLPFALATLAGMLPRTALLAWFGDSLANARWLRAAVALLLIALIVLVGWRMRRRGAPAPAPVSDP